MLPRQLLLAIALLACLVPQAAIAHRREPVKRGAQCLIYAGSTLIATEGSISCADCSKKCLANDKCSDMYHSDVAKLWPSTQGKVDRMTVTTNVCESRAAKCATLKSMAGGGLSSCVLFSSRSNVDASKILAISEASTCKDCLAQWLSRPEINSVTWGGLPPVVSDKTAIIQEHGGQLTGGDGTVTGGYIPQLRAPAVAAKLCGDISAKVTALNFCPDSQSPPVKPPPRPYRGRGGSEPAAGSNTGRRLHGAADANPWYNQVLEKVKDEDYHCEKLILTSERYGQDCADLTCSFSQDAGAFRDPWGDEYAVNQCFWDCRRYCLTKADSSQQAVFCPGSYAWPLYWYYRSYSANPNLGDSTRWEGRCTYPDEFDPTGICIPKQGSQF